MWSEFVMEMIGLKKIRKQKGYSQLKVAMDLAISREALSYYENGKRSPDVNMLVRLSQYFNVSIDYLILGKEFNEQWKHSAADDRWGCFCYFESV